MCMCVCDVVFMHFGERSSKNGGRQLELVCFNWNTRSHDTRACCCVCRGDVAGMKRRVDAFLLAGVTILAISKQVEPLSIPPYLSPSFVIA